MRRFSISSNPKIVFRQGSKNAEYLNHLYLLFKDFVLTPPVKYTITGKNTIIARYNYSFSTLSLPCFNEFYELFYLEGIKVVPKNISDYLTPISLAY
jgi:hypothetical protein